MEYRSEMLDQLILIHNHPDAENEQLAPGLISDVTESVGGVYLDLRVGMDGDTNGGEEMEYTAHEASVNPVESGDRRLPVDALFSCELFDTDLAERVRQLQEGDDADGDLLFDDSYGGDFYTGIWKVDFSDLSERTGREYWRPEFHEEAVKDGLLGWAEAEEVFR